MCFIIVTLYIFCGKWTVCRLVLLCESSWTVSNLLYLKGKDIRTLQGKHKMSSLLCDLECWDILVSIFKDLIQFNFDNNYESNRVDSDLYTVISW